MTNELAIRIITGDVLGTIEQTQEAITMAVKALLLPSAQPETIRCKDCKYWNPYYAECEGIGNWFGFEGAWSENGYCYKAEGREE